MVGFNPFSRENHYYFVCLNQKTIVLDFCVRVEFDLGDSVYIDVEYFERPRYVEHDFISRVRVVTGGVVSDSGSVSEVLTSSNEVLSSLRKVISIVTFVVTDGASVIRIVSTAALLTLS